ncbi:tRNA pseudouridine(38-40) synthase TruA [Tropicimonas sp. TH_r6]|uniref:tRNA pseudouridine(38-40) synthase TruA n=1 Tax=Tropicimonas sp. TH_r6 TaxID=3082085 RepID=UPI0029556DE8|nr:tRNA pseudouridine(38-40) synthase TruA [Tropicimonas sp. TH_r6]MDV7142874.1 tRNA pseudouridine(38-40) synthase TruA [Tropicimonas sp. TH_r6]
MPRYALKIEYDGAPFAGWQRQKEHPSVQQAVEEALGRLQRDRPTIAAAGRTDSGVHALAQVAHADMERDWEPFRLSEALNFHLKPLPVAIVDVVKVSEAWHARFSAGERRYLFRLLNRRAPAALAAGKVWRVGYPLDVSRMRAGADFLLGRHDFTTFRASECQADSPVRTLDQLDVRAVETPLGPEVHFHVRARSFLHNQVRSFVGTLERVGAGAWEPEQVREALEARDRSVCGPVCPPQGLYLAGVGYQPDPFL